MGPIPSDEMGRQSLKVAMPDAIPTDWCVMWRIQWQVNRWQVIRLPADRVRSYAAKGWTLMVSDSEFPVPISTFVAPPPQSGPLRYLDDDEVVRDHGEA